jgi:hypothetical protein
VTPKSNKKRPAWLSDARSEGGGGGMHHSTEVDDPPTRVLDRPAAGEAEGSADSRATASDAARTPREEPRSSGHLDAPGSLTGRLPEGTRRRLLVAGLAALALLIILYGARMLPLFGEAESGQDAPPGQAATYSDDVPSSEIEDTGVVFGGLKTEDGAASLEGAGLKWEGEVEAGETGETITLKGPTAVQIRRGFEMPRSSIQSGVFAVAQESGAVLHVTFHTFDAAETEVTQGSILAVEDDRLDFTGYYRDERQRGSEKVVRTYMPPGGENYRVSFEAPEGTPVPLLVGFRGVS